MYPEMKYVDTDIVKLKKEQTNSMYGMMGGFTCPLKPKHLQIGDTFYVVKGLAIWQITIKAIALQPDGEIVYNWCYRQSDIKLLYEDAIRQINADCQSIMNKLNNDLKGGE